MTDSVTRYRIIIICENAPSSQGEQAAMDITKAFKERPWHQNVICTWNGSSLILQAENDFDEKGRALMDEFSDVISACVRGGFDGNLRIMSVTKL